MKMAGIDVHKKVLMVVVVDARMPEEKPARRRFVTMPSELLRLLTWLQEQGVEEAVMESTAQYWRSVWLELEPHMRLHLAQAFSNRAPRGRKHDFKDAERLVRRLIANELILSFVPNGEQRIWRSMTRMKLQLTRDRVRRGVRFIEQGHEVGPREKKKRAQMLARALRKLGYEVTITPINQLAANPAV